MLRIVGGEPTGLDGCLPVVGPTLARGRDRQESTSQYELSGQGDAPAWAPFLDTGPQTTYLGGKRSRRGVLTSKRLVKLPVAQEVPGSGSV